MEKRLTPDLTCRHCRNVGPMEILHRYSQVRERSDPRSFLEWEEGYVYELLLCPACSGASLRRYYWHDFREPEEIAKKFYSQKTHVYLPACLRLSRMST